MDRQCQRRSAGRPAPVLVGGHAAATREDATEAIGLFVQACQAKYPDGAQCLAKDRDELLSFYDCPAEHWRHRRTGACGREAPRDASRRQMLMPPVLATSLPSTIVNM